MITIIVLRSTIRRNALRLAPLLLVGLFAGTPSKFSFSRDTLLSKRQSTDEYYETTYRMFQDHWLFGVGYGRVLKEWAKYFPEGEFKVRELEDGNHSSCLGILAELGIFGFLSYVGVILFSFWVCIGAYRQSKREQWLLKDAVSLSD